MRFEERELKSYAEHVTPTLLREGEVYWSVQYADEHMLIPIIETWVFAGRKLNPKIQRTLSIFRMPNHICKESAIAPQPPKTLRFKLPMKGTRNTFLNTSMLLRSY